MRQYILGMLSFANVASNASQPPRNRSPRKTIGKVLCWESLKSLLASSSVHSACLVTPRSVRVQLQTLLIPAARRAATARSEKGQFSRPYSV